MKKIFISLVLYTIATRQTAQASYNQSYNYIDLSTPQRPLAPKNKPNPYKTPESIKKQSPPNSDRTSSATPTSERSSSSSKPIDLKSNFVRSTSMIENSTFNQPKQVTKNQKLSTAQTNLSRIDTLRNNPKVYNAQVALDQISFTMPKTKPVDNLNLNLSESYHDTTLGQTVRKVIKQKPNEIIYDSQTNIKIITHDLNAQLPTNTPAKESIKKNNKNVISSKETKLPDGSENPILEQNLAANDPYVACIDYTIRQSNAALSKSNKNQADEIKNNFYTALYSGRYDHIQALLNNRLDRIPLSKEITKILLNKIVDETTENTPLHLTTILLNYHRNKAEELQTQNPSQSSFHTLQANNMIKIIDLLIDENVNINAQNKEGQTPLLLAYKLKDYETAQILLEKGADPQVANNLKTTPLEYIEQAYTRGQITKNKYMQLKSNLEIYKEQKKRNQKLLNQSYFLPQSIRSLFGWNSDPYKVVPEN
ncbi:MAG: ankyrin repeat domain-containing protein [Candidatus Chromulinivorax sp.]